MTVVLTAPRPTSSTPSLPAAGAISTGFFTARTYITRLTATYHGNAFQFRSMRAMDPLQVAMTGVRMGERYLQVFCSDVALTRGLATKTGLSGVAALAAPDQAQAARARTAASKAGALIDVKVVPPATLPWDDDSFDMVVIDNTAAAFRRMTTRDRAAPARAMARRVCAPAGASSSSNECRTQSTSAEAPLRTPGSSPCGRSPSATASDLSRDSRG